MSAVVPESDSQNGAAGEQTLLAKARSGDRQAFDSLSRLYRARLTAFCTRFLSNHAESEDAVQETLLLAWRNLAAFRGEATFATWIFRIARNHCLNRLRGNARPLSLDNGMHDVHDAAPDLLESVQEQLRSRQIVAAVMARLDERDRIILWQHYQERMTSEEISERLPPTMKLSADGVRSRLKRNIRPAIEAVSTTVGLALLLPIGVDSDRLWQWLDEPVATATRADNARPITAWQRRHD